ncbi:MAG: NYN domain-containing protein [Chloroflexota bacterium]
MGKNVAVFVDVANVFYAAKAAGVDIDYVTLLKSVTAGRDLVRAYAYTGLDPDNENQRNFHDFLRRSGYKVVSKDIRKYGDGKVKANLDIELVVDMMKTARNLDIAIVVSGDGDFAPAIRAVQEQGVRVEVLSFRGNTSSDLMDVADLFTDIAQIAKVEKGSSRSGRRVASDDEDLSMTEVPDKLSEGTGTGRGRGRGRTRTRSDEAEPMVAARPRSRSRVIVDAGAVAAAPSSGAALVALPGEKLSKAAVPPPTSIEADGDVDEFVDGEPAPEGEEEPRRRRRRRGGRGRGRGRGHEEGVTTDEGSPAQAVADSDAEPGDEDAEELIAPPPAPARRAAHAFGSVWDSQIGMPSPSAGSGPIIDDEDLDEPPIPEYLIAERRQRDGRGGAPGGRGAGRGVRSGYASAVDRERYGGGRSAPSGGSGGSSRYGQPAPRGGNREPDRFRGDRPAARPVARVGNADEPWSEVPPELEAMLRAQLGSRPAPRPAARVAPEGAEAAAAVTPAAEAPAPKRRSTRKPAVEAAPTAAPEATAPAATGGEEAPRRRATRKPVTVAAAAAAEAPEADAAPKRRTTRTATASAEPSAPAEKAAPKRRTTRKTAEPAD